MGGAGKKDRLLCGCCCFTLRTAAPCETAYPHTHDGEANKNIRDWLRVAQARAGVSDSDIHDGTGKWGWDGGFCTASIRLPHMARTPQLPPACLTGGRVGGIGRCSPSPMMRFV